MSEYNSHIEFLVNIQAHRDEWIRLSAADRNQMDEDLQNKWLKAAQCEEVNDSTLNESLGIEIIVAALKSDSLQVKYTI